MNILKKIITFSRKADKIPWSLPKSIEEKDGPHDEIPSSPPEPEENCSHVVNHLDNIFINFLHNDNRVVNRLDNMIEFTENKYPCFYAPNSATNHDLVQEPKNKTIPVKTCIVGMAYGATTIGSGTLGTMCLIASLMPVNVISAIILGTVGVGTAALLWPILVTLCTLLTLGGGLYLANKKFSLFSSLEEKTKKPQNENFSLFKITR